MPEILLPFADKPAWEAWRGRHGAEFDALRAGVLDQLRAGGLTEPFTGLRRLPEEVAIAPRGLRESLASHELNSRRRALLLLLEAELRARGWLDRRGLRVLLPEALSRLALILRGRFPYLLATEYLPTPELRARHAPVPHLDLQATGLPDAGFDVVVLSEVVEHLPEPDAAWAEIGRVLRPGGLVVACFPFDPNRAETLVRARRGADGRIEHLKPAEHRPNPVDPANPSLVFAVPGWDLPTRLRAAGWDAAMTLVASGQHGVTADGPPGVFVLSATAPGGPARPRPRLMHPAPLPETLCVLLGLPRSGTTLLTALWAVHSRVDAVFEPWNGKLLKGPEDATLPRLLAAAGLAPAPGRVLFVKETAADPAYVGLMRRLVEGAPLPRDRHLLMLCRTPAHVFLSEVERRGQWWNDPVPLDARQFGLWCAKSRGALRAMLAMLRAGDGTLVCYERLAAEPAAMLRRMAHRLGLAVEPAQLDYQRHLDTRMVRGDMDVGSRPAPVSPESIARRAAGERLVEGFAAGGPHEAWFAAFRALHAAVAEAGLLRLRQVPPALLEPLLDDRA